MVDVCQRLLKFWTPSGLLEAYRLSGSQPSLGMGGFPPFEVGAYYLTSPVRPKIHQLFGNSSTYDFKPFLNHMNLVVVDADHTYELVRKDTATALALLAPSGIILWDDYIGCTRAKPENRLGEMKI